MLNLTGSIKLYTVKKSELIWQHFHTETIQIICSPINFSKNLNPHFGFYQQMESQKLNSSHQNYLNRSVLLSVHHSDMLVYCLEFLIYIIMM